jgi:GNAT superfamily N-acetyltransferase
MMPTQLATRSGTQLEVAIHPLAESDLAAADRIFRVAFGTFIGIPDPSAAFGAYTGGALVGSNFAAGWGSVGVLGPLTIQPDLWDRGIAKRLMEPVIGRFETWGTRLAGLFTFAHSQKHIALYQRFGFWPRFLTAIMSKPIARGPDDPSCATPLSEAPPDTREQVLAACRDLTSAIYDGLDLTVEIRAVADQRLGDTVIMRRDGRVTAFAVCHTGAGSEAGSGTCYVKFGAVRPGRTAAEDFDRLLAACEAFAAGSGASRLVAGVNTARHEAYTRLLARGFHTDAQGVVMQRPNEDGYNRPGIYLLDDWR